MMTLKPGIKNIWREMRPAAIRRVALAAFLLFSVLGLVSILIESSIRVFPWSFVAIQTLASGGMAGSIVLCIRKRWWYVLLVILFWSGVMVMNGGGLSFVMTDGEGLRVQLGSSIGALQQTSKETGRSISVSELDAVYSQRGIIGAIAILFGALGYSALLVVIRGETRNRARLEAELRVAQEIQQSLLPGMPFESPACEIAGLAIPATEVGGDYFDVVNAGEGRVAITMADVAGHGIGAGILSAMTKSAFHLQLQHDAEPAPLLRHLNRTIYEVSGKKSFVTFAYALLDPAQHLVRIVTAGHPPALYRRNGTAEVLSIRAKNPALGMRRDAAFSDGEEIQYDAGDLLLLYTDGLIEAVNPKGEQFGEETVCEILSNAKGSPSDLCSTLITRLREFASGNAFADDISLVCVRMK